MKSAVELRESQKLREAREADEREKRHQEDLELGKIHLENVIDYAAMYGFEGVTLGLIRDGKTTEKGGRYMRHNFEPGINMALSAWNTGLVITYLDETPEAVRKLEEEGYKVLSGWRKVKTGWFKRELRRVWIISWEEE